MNRSIFDEMQTMVNRAKEAESAPAVNWDRVEPEVVNRGNKIILPMGMDLQDMVDVGHRMLRAQEQTTHVFEFIDDFPTASLVAFSEAMKELYGWPVHKPIQTVFGDMPPEMVTVEISRGENIQVPVGEFFLPGINESISARAGKGPSGRLGLRLEAEVCKKNQRFITHLAARTREILKDRSIYKGKAIQFHTDSDGEPNFNLAPTFIDLDRVNPEDLILNKTTEWDINVNIVAPMMNLNNLPVKSAFKRVGILYGRYGVGKTMLSQVTALRAVQNGFTYLEVQNIRGLEAALKFARRYEPVLIFCEDIDRGINGNQDLINLIGGIIPNSARVMVVLTTNHIDRIPPIFLRFGRVDFVTEIAPPDDDSLARLIIHYSDADLEPDADLSEVCSIMRGSVASSVHELVKRAKHAKSLLGLKTYGGNHLTMVAQSMMNHMRLLEAPAAPKSKAETALDAMGDFIGDHLVGILTK